MGLGVFPHLPEVLEGLPALVAFRGQPERLEASEGLLGVPVVVVDVITELKLLLEPDLLVLAPAAPPLGEGLSRREPSRPALYEDLRVELPQVDVEGEVLGKDRVAETTLEVDGRHVLPQTLGVGILPAAGLGAVGTLLFGHFLYFDFL